MDNIYVYTRGPTLVRSTLVRGPSLVRSKSLVTTSFHLSAVLALKWHRNASISLLTVERRLSGDTEYPLAGLPIKLVLGATHFLGPQT